MANWGRGMPLGRLESLSGSDFSRPDGPPRRYVHFMRAGGEKHSLHIADDLTEAQVQETIKLWEQNGWRFCGYSHVYRYQKFRPAEPVMTLNLADPPEKIRPIGKFGSRGHFSGPIRPVGVGFEAVGGENTDE